MAITGHKGTLAQRLADDDRRLVYRANALLSYLSSRHQDAAIIPNLIVKPLHTATRNTLKSLLRDLEVHEGIK